MKDVLITTRRQKTELKYLIASFVLAFCLNICAILLYHTAWRELYTQWFPMLALAIVIYFLLLLIRLFVSWIAGILTKKRIQE